MIQANELRVGNIVEKAGGEYVADFITIQMAHNYNPIPLTAEVLKKCNIPYVSKIEVFIEAFDLHRRIIFDGHSNCGVKYLHQLQNLYFALTGEELNVKL
jgi:hypothetical protein